jgi:hypothetical protein
MLWPGIKYAMYSLQTNSDSIKFIPDVLKLDFVNSSQPVSIGTNPQEIKNILIRDV